MLRSVDIIMVTGVSTVLGQSESHREGGGRIKKRGTTRRIYGGNLYKDKRMKSPERENRQPGQENGIAVWAWPAKEA